MAQTISWIDVLNEETQWHVSQDVHNWLSAFFGKGELGQTVHFTESALERFQGRLASMRRTVDALHFDAEADLKWLDDELASIRLTVRYENCLPQALHGTWPLLHAQIKSAAADDLLDAFAQTLLIPFADFITRACADREAPKIARCEGLFRESSQTAVSAVRSISTANELKWRQEIDLIKDNDLLETPTVQRCADIFVAGPKARFCSDACRFTTFQLAKQLKDPRYHAEKQKKYRSRMADKD